MNDRADSGPRAPAPPFGTLLRRARETAGLSQEALAERAGVSANTVGALERGVHRHPYPASIRALASALELSPAELNVWIASIPRRETALPDIRVDLPRLRAPLIGRERDVANVVALAQANAAIVTVTGPGGVGKTRLAIAVATALAGEFDRVSYFELAPITQAAFVAPTIALAFGLRDVAGPGLIDRLIRVLGDQRHLLVLDNFEQVIDAVPILSELVTGAPGVRVLATSRERLRLADEREYRLAPLDVPDRVESLSVDEIGRSPAVRHFVERAGVAGSGFSLNEANAQAVAEICRWTEGVPLAIELAAAWVTVLTPVALAERLDSRLELLTGGRRDAPLRHRSMYDTIGWSYDLLTPSEQRLFQRLAVFNGGFTLEAVAAITGEAGHDSLSGVAALVDRNLIRRSDALDDSVRFTMFETIREFAWLQLTAGGDGATVRRAHALWCIDLAERAEREMTGAHPERLWQLLDPEVDNLRSALAWLIEEGDGLSALRLIGPLISFWAVRGHVAEGKRWLAAALAIDAPDPVERARPLLRPDPAMIFTFFAGDHDHPAVAPAADVVRECLEIVRTGDDERTECAALVWFATYTWLHGREEEARLRYEEALAIGRRLGEHRRAAWILAMLGNIYAHAGADSAHARGDHDRAETYGRESLAIFEALGDEHGIARALNCLGYIAYRRGEFPAALTLKRDVLSRRLATGYHFNVPPLLSDLADIASALDQPAKAARLYGASEALLDAYGIAHDSAAYAAEDAEEMAGIRRALGGDAEFLAQYDRGRNLTFDQAIEEALGVESRLSP